MKINISSIIVKERVRVDEGDLGPLMESMDRLGLINPITVSDTNELLAGYRRLEAAKRLAWDVIDCRVVYPSSELEKLRFEADENITRKDFTVLEEERYREKLRYLSSRGILRFILWIKRLIKKLIDFLKGLFGRA